MKIHPPSQLEQVPGTPCQPSDIAVALVLSAETPLPASPAVPDNICLPIKVQLIDIKQLMLFHLTISRHWNSFGCSILFAMFPLHINVLYKAAGLS